MLNKLTNFTRPKNLHMTFEQSKYFGSLNPHKCILPIGTFYFCERFCVSEINEGMHLDSNTLFNLMRELVSFYGYNIKLGYISNRIYSYSLDPSLYIELSKEFNFIVASALVVYNDMTFMNANIEKRFAPIKLKCCTNLDEAIEWILNHKKIP